MQLKKKTFGFHIEPDLDTWTELVMKKKGNDLMMSYYYPDVCLIKPVAREKLR
jgi:hypothetical protein